MRRLLPLAALAVLTPVCIGDVTYLWDYDLQSCPPDWTKDYQWDFTSNGLYIHECIDDPQQEYYAAVYTDTVTVPPDTDSLVFHVEQDLTLVAEEPCYSHAYIYGYSSVEPFFEIIEIVDGNMQTSDPIHTTVPVTPGADLWFRFAIEGEVGEYGSDTGYVHQEWLMYDLTLAAYTGGVAFDAATWGFLKSAAQNSLRTSRSDCSHPAP